MAHIGEKLALGGVGRLGTGGGLFEFPDRDIPAHQAAVDHPGGDERAAEKDRHQHQNGPSLPVPCGKVILRGNPDDDVERVFGDFVVGVGPRDFVKPAGGAIGS